MKVIQTPKVQIECDDDDKKEENPENSHEPSLAIKS